MSVRLAVLGLVIEQPGYGYQLARRLEERCEAWGWESSGVYSALSQLEREGHVLIRGGKGAGVAGRGAPRVTYEASSEGVDYFRDWLLGPAPHTPERQELDLRILLSGAEFLPRLIDLTWAQEQKCLDDLQRITPGVALSAMSWREATAILQRNWEIKRLQVRVESLQEARTVMKSFLDRAAGIHGQG